MSGDVVNLRQHRKRRKREEKDKAAEANRIAYGRSKAERKLTDALNRQESRSLDHKRLEPRQDPSNGGDDDPSGS